MKTKFSTIKNIFPAGFFAGLLALGILLYKDYGISLDEPAQRLVGIVNLNFIAQVFGIESILENHHFASFRTQSLMDIQDRHYGVIFEIPAALIELFLDPLQAHLIFPLRHLLTFIYFLVGVLALYYLAKLRFGSVGIALLACLMLILSPRFFADGFYNDKDIVFLSTFLLASLTMVRFLISPNRIVGLVHAVTSAIAIDARLIGFAIPLATVSLLLIKCSKAQFTHRNTISVILIYILFTCVAVIFFWPYLWVDPVNHLIEAFEYISRHPHSAAIMFQGKEVLTSQLPWFYIPLWIAITTPIFYLVFFSIGFTNTLYKFYKTKFQVFENKERLIDLVCIGFFVGPIMAIAVSHTSIYNGWRHLYFIYPFFILISINGIIETWKLLSRKIFIKSLFAIALSVNFLWVLTWIINNHPLQNIYFNSLAGKNWNALYEIDYWGLANRVALKKILSSDDSAKVSIWPGSESKFKSAEPTVFSDQLMLEDFKNKARVTSPNTAEESKYLIVSRNGIYPPKYLSEHGMFKKFDSVWVDGHEILSIYLRRNYSDLVPPKLNQNISFAQSGEGIFYLYGKQNPPINWELWKSKEWQIPESWGTWSNGKTASLTIPKPDKEINKLIIKLRAFVSSQTPSQNIQIWINDYQVENVTLRSNVGQELTINLSKLVNNAKEIKIVFKNLNPQSPKRMGISEDDRDIAIGIETVSFQ